MLGGEVEERARIGAGVRRDRPDLTLLEQVLLVVQVRNICQVDPGDRQDAATVQRFQRGQHQIPDRGE
ncbi:Uncharacterised protein [Mycobacterium tuberculosis]|nr:Uncharacterised protein [Mycobacterium tuberculosis]